MKRGEIWTMAGGKDYAGKPRPVVILQNNRFDKTQSITVCPLTTDPADATLLRILVQPTQSNGLRDISRIMVDKITTVPKSKIRAHVGQLENDNMMLLNRALLVFLGIIGLRD